MFLYKYPMLLISLIVLGKSAPKNPKCEEKSACDECIQIKGCAWCSKVKYEIYAATSLVSKCHSSEKILEICQQEFVENPNTTIKVIANQPMRNGANGNTIQIRPQEVILKLKPAEEEFTIDVQFKKAENYPVDLYYLMDFSSSMSRHKNHLSKLGNKLAETMKNLTTDFQLGFGSFVDKVVLPFTSTLPSHLLRPCPKCRPPYSFKNHMSLTQETTRFSVEVGIAQLSGNIDTPEGVLDALMQTLVCQKELNWRDKARHIIVVSTDAPFHLAGDGKLGGVVEPHDGQCYLNGEGVYTHSLIFDYPSVSEISHKALDNNMNIIFAVAKKVKNEYLALSKEIRGSSMGLLDAGENIADLIKAQYEKITTTIRLTDNSKAPVHITYSALCSSSGKWKNTNECTNIKGGSIANFRLHITISECLEKKFATQKITVKPVGMNETLTIHLEAICDCACSGKNYKANEINSKLCSHHGDLICGVCACHENWIGKNCECSGASTEPLNVTDTTACISNNMTNEICSGHGECKCGLCQCYPRQNPKEERTGKFCECDNYSCKRSNGLMCSGHGICKCGKCSCDPEWSGELCDCPVDTLSCRTENEEEVCSGNGNCNCGVCHCQNNTNVYEHRYAGKYCQICMTCLQQKCYLYNDCVECLSYETGPQADNFCKNCTGLFEHNLIEKLEDAFIQQVDQKLIHKPQEKSKSSQRDKERNDFAVSCISADHAGCTFKYFYYYREGGQLVVWAETKTICPKEVNLYAIVGGTIGSTVFIGLLSLIIWKIIVELHDKKEYEKFERERHFASWGKGENPLFRTATTTYENPNYAVDSC